MIPVPINITEWLLLLDKASKVLFTLPYSIVKIYFPSKIIKYNIFSLSHFLNILLNVRNITCFFSHDSSNKLCIFMFHNCISKTWK